MLAICTTTRYTVFTMLNKQNNKQVAKQQATCYALVVCALCATLYKQYSTKHSVVKAQHQKVAQIVKIMLALCATLNYTVFTLTTKEQQINKNKTCNTQQNVL